MTADLYKEDSVKKIQGKREEFSRTNLILFLSGCVGLILGYVILYFANSTASNPAGYIAPILIIVAILIIIISLIIEFD